MSLSRRDLEILTIVSKESKSIKELAKIFEVSERNIRYYIDNLNFYLNHSLKKKVVIINGEAQTEIGEKELVEFHHNINQNNYMFSKMEREEFILVSLLFKENDFTLKEIEDYLKVSITTLKKDLKNINDYLKNFALYLVNENGVLRVEGNEKKLRHVKMIFALKYLYLDNEKLKVVDKLFFSDRDIIEIVKKYFFKRDLEKIFKGLKEVEKNIGIEFEKEFQNIIFLYTVITFERIEKGIILEKKNNAKFLRETNQYKVILKAMFENDEKKFQYEALHLTEYFLSGYNSESFYENRFSIEIFTYKLLKKIEEDLKVDLTLDKILMEDIIEYLTAAVYRIKNNFTLNQNLQLDEDLLFIKDCVEKNVNLLSEFLLEPLREEEILKITSLVGISLNKKKKLTVSLKEILKVVGKYSEKAELDMIGEELLNIYPTMINDDRLLDLDLDLLDILSEERIKFLQASSVEGAVKLACDMLEEDDYVTSNYKKGVLDLVRSESFKYSQSEKVMICYGKRVEDSKKLGIQILFLEDKLFLNEKEIKEIILISNIDREKHIKIITQLRELLEKKGFFNNLNEMKNEKLVMERLENELRKKI